MDILIPNYYFDIYIKIFTFNLFYFLLIIIRHLQYSQNQVLHNNHNLKQIRQKKQQVLAYE